MSEVTVEQIKSYVEQMTYSLSGNREQTATDLQRLLGIIRGDIPLCGPGVQPLKAAAASQNVQMETTAATPKPRTKKTKAKAKAKPAETDSEPSDEPDEPED